MNGVNGFAVLAAAYSRETMDEVSSHVRLNLPFKLTTRPPGRGIYDLHRSVDRVDV